MSTEPSNFEKEGCLPLEMTVTKELITNLKRVKAEYELTIPRIKEMCDRNGDYLSLSTLRRVFAENSEEDGGFSYDRTLAPLARALLFQDNDEAENPDAEADRLEGLRAVILLKNEEIDRLKDQNDELKQQLSDLRAEYDLRLRFLRDQIELKDRRMDEKDQMINRLMEKCL